MLSKLTGVFSGLSPTKQALMVAAGVGTVAIGAVGAYQIVKKIDNTPPKMWRRAGELNEIYVFPIKSCGPVRMSRVKCVGLGPQMNLLRDRSFMVTNLEGKWVTARQKPKMVLIQPQFDDEFKNMTLSAPGMEDIMIPIDGLYDLQRSMGVVWGETVSTVDCGDEVAEWFSTYLLEKSEGLRLRFYPLNKTTRRNSGDDSGALHDETSYMLLSTASVEDLNTKLEQQVSVLQFRPNFVVTAPLAYAEDDWRWVRIGNTVFKYVKPCMRCMFTNVDPERGISSAEGQPLRTLQRYRREQGPGESPPFGIHLGLHTRGEIGLGDPVYYGKA